MNQDQLELFPAAPGAKRSGGRSVSGWKVDVLIQQAQARGCTHAEISDNGALFVLPALVGRCPEYTYLRLDSPQIRVALTRKSPKRGGRVLIKNG